MKAELKERLPEYVLGTLPDAERDELHALVSASPELQREVDRMTEALAEACASLPPAAPSPDRRARLVDSLAGPDRFRPFFAELCRRFDLTVDALRALLARIDDAAAWETTPVPWVKLIHFTGGPGLPAADAGFVRIAAGTTFPRHSHAGPEMTFILEGRMIYPDRVLGPGDVDEATPDVVHAYQVGPECDLVVMVWHNGITLVGD